MDECKNNYPHVFIILVNYNSSIDTVECIKSIRNSDYKNISVVVVDNKSRKEDLDYIEKSLLDGEILIKSKTNSGFSAGNNIGIKYAIENGADYCLLLNNDTVVDKYFIIELLSVARKMKNAIVTSKIKYFSNPQKIWYAGGTFDLKTSRVEHIGIGEEDKGQFEIIKKVSFISGCCMLIPTHIIDEIGFLSEEYFLYCEDIDYCCKARNRGVDLVYSPKSLVYHKVNASTGKDSTISTYYTVRNNLYIINEYIKNTNKPVAYIYTSLFLLKRVLCHQYSLRVVIRAIRDYKKNIRGKASL